MVRDRPDIATSSGEVESLLLEDLDEIEVILSELKLSRGRGNLIICIVSSPAYREKVIQFLCNRFSSRVLQVNEGNQLISALKELKLDDEAILIWTFPEKLNKDILEALNNFRELFYRIGIPSLLFLTPAALDQVIRHAPDLWRYRGGFHELKEREQGEAFRALEVLTSTIRYRNKEDLLRRKRINEYLLERIKDREEKVKVLNELGVISYLLGQYYDLAEFSKQALAIAHEIGDKQGEHNSLINLGLAHACLGEVRKAIEFFNQALAIAREIGDKSGEGNALGNLGATYFAMGDTRKAIEFHGHAMAIDHDVGNRYGECANLVNLGNAYFALGDPRKAIDYYKQALEIAREIGDRRDEGTELFNMSRALYQIGERARALDCAKSALMIYEQIESPYAEKVRQKLAEWQKAGD